MSRQRVIVSSFASVSRTFVKQIGCRYLCEQLVMYRVACVLEGVGVLCARERGGVM